MPSPECSVPPSERVRHEIFLASPPQAARAANRNCNLICQMATGDKLSLRRNPRRDAESAAHREFRQYPRSSSKSPRDQWGARWLEEFLQDLLYCRSHATARIPVSRSIAILTLASGVLAQTPPSSLSSIRYCSKALPYPQADRLVMVYEDVRLPNYQNKKNETPRREISQTG